MYLPLYTPLLTPLPLPRLIVNARPRWRAAQLRAYPPLAAGGAPAKPQARARATLHPLLASRDCTS